MDNNKMIDALNTLVEINNDRIQGYETASGETEEQDLKIFFKELAKTSMDCKLELTKEIMRLGGIATETTNTTGKLHRLWMDIKAALTGKNRKAILDSCQYGESWTTETYVKVLNDEAEYLTEDQKNMLKSHHGKLKTEYGKVKSMHDTLS